MLPVALYFFTNQKVNKRASARTAKVSALGAVMQPAGQLRRACCRTRKLQGFLSLRASAGAAGEFSTARWSIVTE